MQRRPLYPGFRRALVWSAAGVVGVELFRLGVGAVHYLAVGHPSLPPVAAARPARLVPYSAPAAQVLAGEPAFRAHVYGSSLDSQHVSGIWECDGPARFRWHFDTDESVYILEGLVHVEYRGQRHTLQPGDSAFFPAGVSAVWEVPQRVRKSFLLSEPGRMRRWLRKITRTSDVEI